MISLFIDTTYNNIFFILEKDEKIIDSFCLKNTIKVSDIFHSHLSNFLEKNDVALKIINNLYITKGPGSYTGIRIPITFAKTLKIINNDIKIFTISSLLFNAGLDKAISIIDARGNKSYFAVYDKGKTLIEDQVLDNETCLDMISNFKTFYIKKDFQNIDFVNNYVQLKNFFLKEESVNDVNPVYIKSFI